MLELHLIGDCSDSYASSVVEYMHQGNVQDMGRCVGCGKTGHFKKVSCCRRERVVYEIKVETSQDSEGEIEKASIDSVHLNKIWSSLNVELEMCASANKIVIPYKIDTGSKGNIMPWHIFKRFFKMLQKMNSKRV